jgi:hypothetical protein
MGQSKRQLHFTSPIWCLQASDTQLHLVGFDWQLPVKLFKPTEQVSVDVVGILATCSQTCHGLCDTAGRCAGLIHEGGSSTLQPCAMKSLADQQVTASRLRHHPQTERWDKHAELTNADAGKAPQ